MRNNARAFLVRFSIVIMVFLSSDAVRGEEPESKQSRTNLGVGAVSNGLGNGSGAGCYDYEIFVYSHKRYNTYADDGGHSDYFCGTPDKPWTSCSNFPKFDGVKLRQKSFRNVSGLAPNLKSNSAGEVLGPFHKQGGSSTEWEWPDEKATAELAAGARFFTRRDTRLLWARYEDVNWTGSRSAVASRLKADWFESDPKGCFILCVDPADDDSEVAYFEFGDMAQKCLQAFGGNGTELTVLSSSQNFYWNLCSKDGDCAKGDGTGGLHYKIKTYYRVTCKRWKKSCGSTGGGGGGGGGCFAAGTQVAMADGTSKPIERVVEGDQVLSYDLEKGRVVVGKVTRKMAHPDPGHPSEVLLNGNLRVTPDHFVYTDRGWVAAGRIAEGDVLLSLPRLKLTRSLSALDELTDTRVLSHEYVDASGAVYNLDVAEWDNYFANGTLVSEAKAPPEE